MEFKQVQTNQIPNQGLENYRQSKIRKRTDRIEPLWRRQNNRCPSQWSMFNDHNPQPKQTTVRERERGQ